MFESGYEFFCTQITRRAQSFLFSLAYYAGAGGVANFVTRRVRRGGDVSEAVYYLLHCFCDSVSDTACRVPTCKCRVVSSNHSPPYRANKVFRGLTECQSVPCEGSNPHCDARTGWGWVRHFYVSVRLCALCRAKRATNPATALFALLLCVLCALCVRFA